jgi:signal transduction histidine kinase
MAWTAGHVLLGLYLALGVQAMVGFPGGTTAGRLAVAVVVAAYTAKVLLQPAQLLFRDPRAHGCADCGPNLLLIREAPGAHHAVDLSLNVAQIAIAGGMIWLLASRWRTASAATRRALGPVLIAIGIVTAVALVTSALWVGRSESGHTASRVFLFSVALIPAAVLVGLLRARLARAGVASLVVELGRDPSPDRIEAAIARALRDPSCRVAFYIPEIDGYADANGEPVTLPDGDPDRVVTELHHDGIRIAALICDRTLELNPRLLESVAAAARLALENSRLQAELRVQLARVRDSRVRIVEAADEARRRLERDLHDGTQQYAVKALIDLDDVRRVVTADTAAADRSLDLVREDLDQLLASLRSVARGLHPSILTDQGLRGALEGLAMRASIPVTVGRLPASRLPPRTETAAYYVCAEALTNVQKHAAASAATIDAVIEGDTLRVVVSDDGVGGAADSAGGGLTGLRDRVDALGGSVVVDSPAGGGTRVEALIPCA